MSNIQKVILQRSPKKMVLKQDSNLADDLKEQAESQLERVLSAFEQRKILAGSDLPKLQELNEEALQITMIHLNGAELPEGFTDFLTVLRSDIEMLESEKKDQLQERASATSITKKLVQLETIAKRLAKSPDREAAFMLKQLANEEAAKLMKNFDSINDALADPDVQKFYELASYADGLVGVSYA